MNRWWKREGGGEEIFIDSMCWDTTIKHTKIRTQKYSKKYYIYVRSETNDYEE